MQANNFINRTEAINVDNKYKSACNGTERVIQITEELSYESDDNQLFKLKNDKIATFGYVNARANSTITNS